MTNCHMTFVQVPAVHHVPSKFNLPYSVEAWKVETFFIINFNNNIIHMLNSNPFTPGLL